MTDLTTVEAGTIDLIDSELDGILIELDDISQAYNLPTNEEDLLKLVILVAEKKLDDLKKIDEVVL